jgi:hypothetical protein
MAPVTIEQRSAPVEGSKSLLPVLSRMLAATASREIPEAGGIRSRVVVLRSLRTLSTGELSAL